MIVLLSYYLLPISVEKTMLHRIMQKREKRYNSILFASFTVPVNFLQAFKNEVHRHRALCRECLMDETVLT